MFIPLAAAFTVASCALVRWEKTKPAKDKFRLCALGTEFLLLFVLSVCVSLVFEGLYAIGCIPDDSWRLVLSLCVCALVLSVAFWSGIVLIYISSVQLGIKIRVIGLLCGFIPIANIIVLGIIIGISLREVRFESEKN